MVACDQSSSGNGSEKWLALEGYSMKPAGFVGEIGYRVRKSEIEVDPMSILYLLVRISVSNSLEQVDTRG